MGGARVLTPQKPTSFPCERHTLSARLSPIMIPSQVEGLQLHGYSGDEVFQSASLQSYLGAVARLNGGDRPSMPKMRGRLKSGTDNSHEQASDRLHHTLAIPYDRSLSLRWPLREVEC